ncbi:hypothetical protein N7494_004886 [Penicillium frequentans]|uniref:CENP-V/GFA domain-containing protein n=1 Tax=Penicillium frequentans TaxID=3151616 RepID=A0AAD6D3I2_9EURO|nr:hypothetical protein N7494_004886 [Penicillium glabrum]
MSYTGHCNCESIHVTLPEQPPKTGVCHCSNCKRVGGAFSVNYFVPEDDLTIDDPNKTLKIFVDSKTASGHVIQRNFCSNCGSAIFTKSPKAPGKVFLKATLFDTVSPKGGEVFGEQRLEL